MVILSIVIYKNRDWLGLLNVNIGVWGWGVSDCGIES